MEWAVSQMGGATFTYAKRRWTITRWGRPSSRPVESIPPNELTEDMLYYALPDNAEPNSAPQAFIHNNTDGSYEEVTPFQLSLMKQYVQATAHLLVDPLAPSTGLTVITHNPNSQHARTAFEFKHHVKLRMLPGLFTSVLSDGKDGDNPAVQHRKGRAVVDFAMKLLHHSVVEKPNAIDPSQRGWVDNAAQVEAKHPMFIQGMLYMTAALLGPNKVDQLTLIPVAKNDPLAARYLAHTFDAPPPASAAAAAASTSAMTP